MRKIVYSKDKIECDSGVFFGEGLFETILVKDKPILFEEHIERLKRSLNILGMEELKEEDQLRDAVSKMNLKDISLKVTVTPSNIILSTRNVTYKEEDYAEGFKLKISNVIRNSTSVLTRVKSTCYIENIIEKRKAVEDGYNDVIFLNEKGFVTETSCANIFIQKDNKIYTPKEECGLLPGIIRSEILKKYNVIETELTIDDLKNCDSVFITNSLMGIMNVKAINEVTYDSKIEINIF